MTSFDATKLPELGHEDIHKLDKTRPMVVFGYSDDQVMTHHVGRCYPTPEQNVFAEAFVTSLNTQLDKDGFWLVILDMPEKSYFDRISRVFRVMVPHRWNAQWHDRDGDVQFVVDNEDDPARWLDFEWSELLAQCEEAHKRWREAIDNLDLSDRQTFKQAQGETLDHEYEDAPDHI